MGRRAGDRSAIVRALAGLTLAMGIGCTPGPRPFSPQVNGFPDSTRAQVLQAIAVAESLRTPDAAQHRGFVRIAPTGVSGLNPLQGEHWINDHTLRRRRFDTGHPGYVMYYPLGDPPRETLVGVAYAFLRLTTAPAPEGFAGPADAWHVHLPCYEVPGLGYALEHSIESCRAFGGTPAEVQIWMVHVWTHVPSPDGPFALNNPALPFLAAGLQPPTAGAFHDPQRGVLLRQLAVALGETFGAVPRAGARIAQDPDSVFADRVRPHRDRIRALLPALRAARRASDVARFDALARDAVRVWHAIRDAYLDAAFSPQHRAMLERWFTSVTTWPEADHAHAP